MFTVFLLTIFSVLPPLGIFVSFDKINISSNFFVLASNLILLFVFLLLIAYYIHRRPKKADKDLKKLPDGLKGELKSLYEILSEYESRHYKPRKILPKVLPYIKRILRNYKRELSDLPGELVLPFSEIYKSVEGKHRHYHEKRLKKNLRDLKNSLEEILKYST